MSNLPTPPTDNLYKFMAISGVVIAIGVTFCSFQFGTEALRQTLEANAEQSASDLEGKVIRQHVEAANSRVKRSSEKLEAMQKRLEAAKGPEKEAVLRTIQNELAQNAEEGQDIVKQLRENEQNLVSSGRRQVLAIAKKGAADAVWSTYVRLATPFAVMGGIGLVVAYLGFQLWYLRLQRYQDKIVRDQAEPPEKKEPKKDIVCP